MSEQTEALIRESERARLAAALEGHAETIAEFAADKERAVLLVAHLLRCFEGTPALVDVREAIHDAGLVDHDQR